MTRHTPPSALDSIDSMLSGIIAAHPVLAYVVAVLALAWVAAWLAKTIF